MAFEAKKLINDPNDVVTEFVEGLVETYTGLQYLDGFPEVKVVLRADVSSATYNKVAVISGGGSGHEPAHAGYVGEGMLTAAICGDVFASPPVNSILAGIRAVTGAMGCLLIVTNYTGDRLNFGLAAEQAKSEGFKIETVIVGDDCALPRPRGIVGRRGLAGTILVHKHGEPGAAMTEIQPVDIIVSHVLKQILSSETGYVPITRGNKVLLMINGLGATPMMELMIAAGKAVPRLQVDHGLAVDRVYTGSFMTSLDMSGFSISIMKADQLILERLDAPTKAPSWPVGVDGNHPPTKIPMPMPPSPLARSEEVLTRPSVLNEQGHLLEAAIEAATNEIITMKDNLNELDGKVGDGDCGSTMARGAETVLDDMRKCYPLNDAAETVNEIGASIRRVMGGTSGILYDIFCMAAYAKLKESKAPIVTAKQWLDALEASIAAVSKYGGAMAGYRTMLDALIPASAVLRENLYSGNDPSTAFLLSSEAAFRGAESTKHMTPQAGRSTYVSGEVLSSVPDPGAMAAAVWYRAAALAVHKKLRGS